MRCHVALCLVACVLLGCASGVALAPPPVVATALIGQLREAPPSNELRRARLARMFEAAGCRPIEQSVPDSELPNLICRIRGNSSQTIVVGAHYDKTAAGDGVADNWAGVVLLGAVYAALSSETAPELSLDFVGFAAEELGLLGSRQFVAALSPEERESIRAMVNLDSLGWAPIALHDRGTSDGLSDLYDRVSAELGVRSRIRRIQAGPKSDYAPFQDAGIETISFLGIHRRDTKKLHTEFDRFEAIRLPRFLESYVIVESFIRSLAGAERAGGGRAPAASDHFVAPRTTGSGEATVETRGVKTPRLQRPGSFRKTHGG